jgi:hypothetical protein
MDLLDVSGRTAVSAFLLCGPLQQRSHANLDGSFGGVPQVPVAGAKPTLDLSHRGRFRNAVRGEGDNVHLGATFGTPSQSCLGLANYQECVGFYSDSGRPLHHGSLRFVPALLRSAWYERILQEEGIESL